MENGRVKNQSNALVYGYSFAHQEGIRHLDYGSGDGRLTKKLTSVGFDSIAYDPFFQSGRPVWGIQPDYDL